MEALGFIIEVLFDACIFLIPSKRERKIRKRIRILKNEAEFTHLKNRFGNVFFWKPKVRNFIYEQPVETIVTDEKTKRVFFIELERLCEK